MQKQSNNEVFFIAFVLLLASTDAFIRTSESDEEAFVLLLASTDAFIRTSESDQEEEVKIIVKIPQNGYRWRRSADEFPDDMDIDLPVGGNHVRISLHRNYHIDDQVPVTVQRNGKILRQTFGPSQKVVFYTDLTSGSAFMVQRNNNSNIMDEYDFFGIFHSNESSYFLQPPGITHKSHTISQVEDVEPVASDFLVPNDFEQTFIPETKKTHNPNKRQTTVYEIEVLMVADFSIFTFWRNRASGSTAIEIDQNAKSLMRQYCAFLLSAIDLRYMTVTGDGYEVVVLFAGLHIADTAGGSPWTETIKNTATTPARVDSSIALDSFQTWMNDEGGGGALPAHDHAMLFTRYDLERNGSNTVAGLAYLSRLCTTNRQSINEDGFRATTGTIAAHELGHNLGASHDGPQDGNACSANIGYVMEASVGVTSDGEKTLRLWEFSTCSVDYFSTYITTLDTGNNNCMTSRSPSYNASALDDFSDQMAGQIYPPDNQCEASDGTGSYMCRQFLDFDYSTICSYMLCALVPANNGTCFGRVALEGTSCGNGKVCQKGLCIDSNAGPTGLTETCLFGDQPQTVANEGLSCTDLIAGDQTKCYTKGEECCETCGVVAQSYTNLTNCPYGNKASGCGAFPGTICYVSENNRDVCCDLCQNGYTGIVGCEYGDKATWCSTITVLQCYTNNDTCCQHCLQFETGITGCEYGDQASWCSTITATDCYLNDAVCCQHCLQFETGIAGCEYGDRASDCVYTSCQLYDEVKRTDSCCYTCRDTTTTITPPITTATTTSQTSTTTINAPTTRTSTRITTTESAAVTTTAQPTTSTIMTATTTSTTTSPTTSTAALTTSLATSTPSATSSSTTTTPTTIGTKTTSMSTKTTTSKSTTTASTSVPTTTKSSAATTANMQTENTATTSMPSTTKSSVTTTTNSQAQNTDAASETSATMTTTTVTSSPTTEASTAGVKGNIILIICAVYALLFFKKTT